MALILAKLMRSSPPKRGKFSAHLAAAKSPLCEELRLFCIETKPRDSPLAVGAKAFSKETDAPGHLRWHHVGEQKRILARGKKRAQKEKEAECGLRDSARTRRLLRDSSGQVE